jgi:hypothetical protein
MDNNDKKNPVISPLIKDHYEVIKVLPGNVYFGDTKYDLTTIDLKTADELVKLNFPYLVKKETAKTAKQL